MSGRDDGGGLDHEDGLMDLAEFKSLKEENQVLAQQIKQLVKAEGRLYDYQQVLDAQLKEYKDLYELSRRLNATFDIQKTFSNALEYIVHSLEFERAIFFFREDGSSQYDVVALDGYYEDSEKDIISNLTLNQNDSLLKPYFEGCEYRVLNNKHQDQELLKLGESILMSEYIIYALGSHLKIPAFLVVGNSADNAEFYKRIDNNDDVLLGIGNLTGLLSSSLENHISFKIIEKALDQERITKAKYLGIFENAAEGIIQLTPKGRFTSCNQAAAKILGYDTPKEMPRYFADVIDELKLDNKIVETMLEQIKTGANLRNLELSFVRKDGSNHAILLSTRAVYSDEQITSIEGIILDISDRIKAREELQRAYDQLEIRVKERTEELASTNDLLLDEILERTRIEEKLRELSEIDPLTMIYNRRKFFELISREVDKSKRYDRPLSLIMYDLDYFKKINDKFGHQTGDKILKSTVGTVCGIIRKVDVFARYGGDEFIILCPETNLAGARILAERIKGAIANQTLDTKEEATLSIGVAEFNSDDTVDTFIEKVDEALYAAKNEGRDRVCVSESHPAA
jgi:diguanylate cyclase (GGDEF)-like protein/PAS domain S-box-containing protein